MISALRRQGTPADLVQVGNEINGGLLWPDGCWDNWAGIAALLTAGASAVKAADRHAKVVLHLAEGGNNGGVRWWFDNAVAYGVPFDVIGALLLPVLARLAAATAGQPGRPGRPVRQGR